MRGRGLHQRIPCGRRLVEEIAAVIEQPDVEIAWNLQERSVDSRELERLGQEIVALARHGQIVEGRQPSCLRGGVLRVRRDQIEIRIAGCGSVSFRRI